MVLRRELESLEPMSETVKLAAPSQAVEIWDEE